MGLGGPTSRSARVRGSSGTLPQRLARVATTSQSRREAKCGEINNPIGSMVLEYLPTNWDYFKFL